MGPEPAALCSSSFCTNFALNPDAVNERLPVMKWDDLKDQPCSVARTVAVIGDRWTLMLLRDCFLGVRRFEAFQERLGISRTIITDRLKTLVDEGVLRRVAYQDRPPRHEYRLTQKGLDLYPVIMAIVHWGNVHYAGEAGPPMLHRHRTCGHDIEPVLACKACGEALDARAVEVRPGPGLKDPGRATAGARLDQSASGIQISKPPSPVRPSKLSG